VNVLLAGKCSKLQVEMFSSLKKIGVDKLSQKLDSWYREIPPAVEENAEETQ